MSDRLDEKSGKPVQTNNRTGVTATSRLPHRLENARMTPKTNTLNDYEDIPVEELVRLTRELTQRITNADRQRLAEELQSTGHQVSIQTNGPLTLQQFFTGEIDLDTELAQRFANAPLMSSAGMNPRKPTSMTRRVSAVLTSQDAGSMFTLDVDRHTGQLESSFTIASMLSFRFDLGLIPKQERHRWVELMQRSSGIAFLWTKDRWEKDYMIWVVREYFTRVYAFSPGKFEAAVRMTPDTLQDLLGWCKTYWLENTGEDEKRTTKQNIRLSELQKRLEADEKADQTTKTDKPAAQKNADSMQSTVDKSGVKQSDDQQQAPPSPSTDTTRSQINADDSPSPDEQSDASVFEW